MSMHRIERIESAAERLEHLIQQAIFLRNESFDVVVEQWLETTKSISSTVGMQEIVFAAEQLLDSEGYSKLWFHSIQDFQDNPIDID